MTIYVILFFAGQSLGQQSTVKKLDSLAVRLVTTVRNLKEEKAYLKTDKIFYSAGEKIWFRVFLIRRFTGRLTGENRRLFIDLVTENDKIVGKVLLPTANFKTDGTLVLSDTLTTGFYWLRAYTLDIALNHPLNIDVQPIYVINQDKPAAPKNYSHSDVTGGGQTDSAKLHVEFYPEGGSVISGATTALGLRITDSKGIPLKISGIVKDNQNSVVTSFQSNLNGLGKILLSPINSLTYTVHINHGGQELIFPLPKTDPYAAQLSIVDKKGLKYLRVILEDSIYRTDKKTYLIGLSGDSLCFAGIGSGSYELALPETQFPYGIADFLLFDENQHILSERMLFISANKLNINVKPDKTEYLPRQPVQLNISISDFNGRPLVGSMYAKVTDSSINGKNQAINADIQKAGALSDFTQWTILDHPFTDEELELVMLTQKKSLGQVISSRLGQGENNDIMDHESDSSFFIRGTILDRRGNSMKNRTVTLFTGTKNVLALADTTDSNGRFCFPLVFYYDQTKLNLQVTDKRGVQLEADIKVDTPHYFPKLVTPPLLKQKFSIGGITEYFTEKRKISMQDTIIMGKDWLKEVVVHSIIKKPADYNVNKRLSSFSKILSGKMLQNGGDNNIGNALFKIPGITLRDGYLVIRGGNGFHHPSAADEPLLILDGVAVTLPDGVPNMNSVSSPLLGFLSTLSVRIIDFIEVLSGPEAAIYGSRAFNGVIVVNTKTMQSEIGETTSVSMKTFTMPGYQEPVEFKEPDYSLKEIRNSKLPDRRTVIYWNGDVITNEKGKVSLTFYTADPQSRYYVTVTGVTADGRLVSTQTTIDRK